MTTKTPVKQTKMVVKRGRADADIKYDVRLRSRNLREGVLSRADIDKHLKALPDVASKAETLGGGRIE